VSNPDDLILVYAFGNGYASSSKIQMHNKMSAFNIQAHSYTGTPILLQFQGTQYQTSAIFQKIMTEILKQ
jgi:hypothetical protein